MAKIIDFEKYKPTKISTRCTFEGTGAVKVISFSNDASETTSESLQATIELLSKTYPGIMVFTQKEAAKILSVSYQYINKNCKEGNIRTVKFGDRQLININELAKLINEGI